MTMKRLLLLLTAALCAVSCATTRRAAHPAPASPAVPADGMLLISKASMRLDVLDRSGVRVRSFPVACGENYGDKEREGDRKTPEGLFWVQEIVDTAPWSAAAAATLPDPAAYRSPYGPRFIRLLTPPHTGIGIHGTNDDASVGSRASAGCVRLHNDDLMALLPYVYIGMPVFITPSAADEAVTAGRSE